MYTQAPQRLYSCSTRIAVPGRQGWVGCLRRRAWMLVFSSAEITNSSSLRHLPCQPRAYRSSSRPAFSAKSGWRGKSNYDGARDEWHPHAASAKGAATDGADKAALACLAHQITRCLSPKLYRLEGH